MEYPIYRKYTFGKDSEQEHTIYLEFTELMKAKCIYVEGTSKTWHPGVTREAPVNATSNAWDKWDGIHPNHQPIKIYKIKKDKDDKRTTD